MSESKENDPQPHNAPGHTQRATAGDSGKLGALKKPSRRTIKHRLIGALLVLVVACFLLSTIGAAGLIGARSGAGALKVHVTQTANANLLVWFQHGLDQLHQGNYQLAEANFEAVLREQPDNVGVQQLLATARVAQTPTATPVPPTPTPIITDKAELLARAKQAFDQKNWDSTINLLDQLRAIDGSYERTAVEDMRYTALVSRGLFRLSEGDIEAGLYDLDIASTIKPLSPQVESQRQMAAMYQNALYYVGADWSKAISLLTQVYKISPGYRDVALKLFDAYESAGDAYAGALDWCPAELSYAGALRIQSNTRVQTKHDNAQQRCLAATPTGITNTQGTTGTVSGENELTGRIIFASSDPTSGAYQLRAYNASTGQVSVIETGGSQPAYQRTAGVVAYSVGGRLHGLYSNGAIGSLGNFAGQWPSLSPDGTRIAFTMNQNGQQSVAIAPINGSSAPLVVAQGTYPVWGPGGLIAYQGCLNGACGIYVINPDQPGTKRKVTTTASDISIQWSPDGNTIVYMTNYTGNWQIYSASLSGQFRQLTSGPDISAAPTFSPDGTQVAFESNRDGSWGIYVMSVNGTNVRKVVTLGPNNNTWQQERLAWTP